MNEVEFVEIRHGPLHSVPTGPGRGGWWPLVREPFTGAWQRNQEWTTDTVAAHHAVYTCVTRVAQDIGKLSPRLVQFDSRTGIWQEITNTAHSPVLAQPNRFQNHIQFKAWWITCLLLHGNVYVLKRHDAALRVDTLYLLDPTRVKVLVAPDGEVFYELRQDFLSEQSADSVTVPASELVHDRINCLFHPLVGTSPIFACGCAANMGLRIEQNSADFFGNGSNPSGVLSSPQHITKQRAEELQEVWNSQYTGENSGRVAMIGDGMKFEPMRMTAVDSQLIEQLKWSAETVCSTFHVPPWKIGVGSQPAYTKPEIANQAYYSDCLQALIEQWELCMDEALGLTKPIDGRGRLGVELGLDGLLRMDAASQVETLTQGISGSLLTVNGARRRFNEPPVPGGDTIWMQQQNYSLEALAERDKNDPFAKPEPPAPATPAPDEEEEPEEERAARLTLHVARAAITLRQRMIAA